MKVVVDNSNLQDAGIDPVEMEELRNGFDGWMAAQGGIKKGEVCCIVGRAGVGRSKFFEQEDEPNRD